MTDFSEVKRWAWRYAWSMNKLGMSDGDRAEIYAQMTLSLDELTKIHEGSESFRKSAYEAFSAYDEYLKYKYDESIAKSRLREAERVFNEYKYGGME